MKMNIAPRFPHSSLPRFAACSRPRPPEPRAFAPRDGKGLLVRWWGRQRSLHKEDAQAARRPEMVPQASPPKENGARGTADSLLKQKPSHRLDGGAGPGRHSA